MLKHPLVYEVHARAWLRTLARRAGVGSLDLRHVPDSEIGRLAGLGFTHLWLMGVWSIGPAARRHACRMAREGLLREGALPVPEAEVCGSPYAIHAYEVPAALGGEAGLREFRTRLHRHGMRLLLDFVPNHVALDHPWVTRHPELFVQSAGPADGFYSVAGAAGRRWIAHGRDPYFPPWTDTAQLDWRRVEVLARMQAILEGIADRCDGIRADMAMLILPRVFERQWGRLEAGAAPAPSGGFWPGAIRAVRGRHPGFLFLAEAYWDLEAELLAQGFDFVYDKRFYDCLVAHRLPELRQHLERESATLWNGGARFLENHDEARVRTVCADDEQRAWATLLLGLPGLRLIHDGQMEGLRRPHDIRCEAVSAATPDPALLEGYRECLGAVRRMGLETGTAVWVPATAAWDGNPSHGGVVAVLWTDANPSPRALVVTNLARHRAQCRLDLGPHGIARGGWSLKPALEPAGAECPVQWAGETVLACDMQGPGAVLLEWVRS